MSFIRKNDAWIFLGGLSLAGIALVFYATATYGAGLPTDGVRYISAADNWLAGHGLYYYDGGPLIWFPPLFPLLIATLSWLFRADVFVVGWVLNAVLWGVNLFLSGLVLRKVFGSRSIYFYLATLLVFCSSASVNMHTNLLTEPLFLTSTLLFFLAAAKYLEKPSLPGLIVLVFLSIGASMLRWAGFSQILAGGVIILFAHRHGVKQFLVGVVWAAVFGIVSFLPVVAWIYFHNYLPYGTFWGSSSAGHVFPLENLLQALRKIFYWFIPYRPISPDGKIEPLIFVGLMFLVFLLLNKKQDWLNWCQDYLRPDLAALAIFSAINFAATTFMAQTNDHRALISDRYYALLLVPILVLLFQTLERLLFAHLRQPRTTINIFLLVIFLVWTPLPISRFSKYLQDSRENGEASYNIHNLRIYHESETIAQVQALLKKDPHAVLYSNIPAPVWFFTRTSVYGLIPDDKHWNKDQFKEQMAGWPYDKPGYVIWFKDDPYKIFFTPAEMYLVADIAPVFEASDGVIYSVSARK